MLVAFVHRATAAAPDLDDIRGGENEPEFRAAVVALDRVAVNVPRRPEIAGGLRRGDSGAWGAAAIQAGTTDVARPSFWAREAALGEAAKQRVFRDSPAGRFIKVERRRRKTARPRVRIYAEQVRSEAYSSELTQLGRFSSYRPR